MAAAENTRTQSIKGADTELDILLSTYSVHAATMHLAGCRCSTEYSTYCSWVQVESLGETENLVGVAGLELENIFFRKTHVPIPRTTIPDSPSKSKHCWYLNKDNESIERLTRILEKIVRCRKSQDSSIEECIFTLSQHFHQNLQLLIQFFFGVHLKIKGRLWLTSWTE